MKIPLDIIGDIAIFKFPREVKLADRKKYALKFLRDNKNVGTALEKTDKVKGRFRLAKTRFLAGENRNQTLYKENNCKFLINVDKTYFSPRLSSQRKYIAEDIFKKITSKKNKIIVMFAGIAPFPIVIAKTLKVRGKNVEIISSEINSSASKCAGENVVLNKVQDFVSVISGDSKNLLKKLPEKYKADFIVMPRPNLKDTFLGVALKLSRKGTRVYYYGFGTCEKVLSEVSIDLKKLKAKTSKLKISKAGDIGPRKNRWLIEFFVK